MAETHSYSTLDDDETEVNYVYMQFSKSFRVYIQMHKLPTYFFKGFKSVWKTLPQLKQCNRPTAFCFKLNFISN